MNNELLIKILKSNNSEVKSNNEEKQIIEEMAQVLKDYTERNHIMASHVILECYAEELYSKNYRKQSELEKLENKLFKEVFESVLFSLVYLGADGKWHTKRNNSEKTTAIIERYLKLVAIEEGGAE